MVTDHPPGKFSGRLLRSDSAAVYVVERGSGDTVAVPWRDVREIYVGTRLRSKGEAFRRGAKVGLIVSGVVAVAAIATAVSYDLRGECYDCFIPVSVFIVPMSYLFTIAGTATGGVIGLAFTSRWDRAWPD